jgi:hypothetical protein
MDNSYRGAAVPLDKFHTGFNFRGELFSALLPNKERAAALQFGFVAFFRSSFYWTTTIIFFRGRLAVENSPRVKNALESL